MELNHVLGRTYCAELTESIPIYRLNEREVILLDSGYADRDRSDLLALLEREHLKVRAIIGSHSHNDHSGNHRYFQETQGAVIVLHIWEAQVVSSYTRMKSVYRPGTAKQMEQFLPHFLLTADQTFSDKDTSVEVCGETFGLLHTPGHTPGHTSIVTPDGVCYVGDAVISERTMQKAKMPTVFNWEQDLESKRNLAKTSYPAYILAHRGVYQDISYLAEQNCTNWEARAEQVRSLLKKPLTMNEIHQLLWDVLGLHTSNELGRLIFQRNVECLLEYLTDTGRVERIFEHGTYYYTAVSKF